MTMILNLVEGFQRDFKGFQRNLPKLLGFQGQNSKFTSDLET